MAPEGVGDAVETDAESLAKTFDVLANPVRVDLLHRLARPCFMRELVDGTGLTRQALRRHVDALLEAGLVRAVPTRRGALPATRYEASAAGLFAFKERVGALAVDPASTARAEPTLPSPDAPVGVGARGRGLLLVHGDAPGRWYPLADRPYWILGRDEDVAVPLAYDAFASQRHATLRPGPNGLTLTDLDSTNGTFVNFQRIHAGVAVPVRAGDVLTVGRSHLLLRDGR